MSGRKRFYKSAFIEEAKNGYQVLLDGRPIRTPIGGAFILPGRALGEAVRAEWDEQAEFIRPSQMGLTQIINTAIDRVAPRRKDEISDLLRYVDTDLLCYRATDPKELVELQERSWQPVLDWLEKKLDAAFIVARGVMPIAQPGESKAAVEKWLEDQNDFRLAAIHLAAHALGSLFLAAALVEARLSAEEAFNHSQIDEMHQIARWGEDEEATIRQARLKSDVLTVDRFLKLLAE